jgi:hypothetical protein
VLYAWLLVTFTSVRTLLLLLLALLLLPVPAVAVLLPVAVSAGSAVAGGVNCILLVLYCGVIIE